MKHISVVGRMIVATCVLSGLGASTASAAVPLCLLVNTPKTGNYSEGCATKVGNGGEWVLAQLRHQKVGDRDLWCALVDSGQTEGVLGWETSSECTTEPEPAHTGSKWIRVEVVLARPQFVPSAATGWAFPISFTASSGPGFLKATEEIRCEKSKSTGEVLNAEQVGNVVVTFEECYKGHHLASHACHSIGEAAGSLTIKTVALSGTLGKVPAGEASSEVGLLLAPESGTDFTAIEKEKCASITTKVTGSVIGEVQPVGGGSSTTGYLLYAQKGTGSESEEKLQKIMAFEGAPEDVLDAFGPSSINVKQTITFSQALEVSK